MEDGHKTKRSTIACTYCRERKIKCNNTNDGQPCDRCKRGGKECEYKPITMPLNPPVSPPLVSPPYVPNPAPWVHSDAHSLPRPPLGGDPSQGYLPPHPPPVGQQIPSQEYHAMANPLSFPSHQYPTWQYNQYTSVQGAFPPLGNSSQNPPLGPNHEHMQGSQTDDGEGR